MKNIYKIISMLLTVFMILSALTVLFTVEVFAAEETETESTTESESTEESGKAKESVDYINQYFATPEEKLETMDIAYEKDGIRLYVDAESGEVAYVNTKTGEKLFTNPYDVASSTGNETTKYEILSQIIVTFQDSVGQERIFTSYEEAASRNQIVVENIKGGIRVEYTIGREQSKILVPRLISMERFEEMILAPLYEVFGEELYNPRSQDTKVFDVQKMLSYFMVYSVDKLDLSKKDRQNMENTYGGLYDDLISSDAQYARALKKFPIVETMPVYVFDPDASEAELSNAEEIIMKYCPEYTYEELEYDHILTEYKSDDANPPVFRMALEYKADASGLSVRLPANGIRFNESIYTLEHIQILPYMGAGNSAYEGYNFFPDGSGTLFDFQSLNTNQTRAVSGKVYGTDFAYHEITGTYQKTIRYPVFGIVEKTRYYTYTMYDEESGEKTSEFKIAGNIVDAIDAFKKGETVNFCNGQVEKFYNQFDENGRAELLAQMTNENTSLSAQELYEKFISQYGELYIPKPGDAVTTESIEKRGFVCIIEEGDALASLSTYHAGALSDYNTVKMQFTPRPKDSYNISDSISVGSNSEWTVVSDRKYVGNYMMKYITLSDAEKAEEKTVYDASWFGMAVAYRDYLTNKGVISKLDEKELTDSIPLYIETFGTIETTEKILSIPVTVMAPLTTFDNVETMYKELAAQGMKNINFKLTGYANGGLQYTMPGKLKFEKAVGGNDGFQELLDAANKVNKDENSNFGVFPDFDFAYTMNSEAFDGHSAYKHNAKTIDDRYASKRVYKATQQKYENYHEMIISPAYFAEFYEKLKGNYADKYEGVLGISVSTLGNALNSDFDEDEPYNREDAKEFTVEAFKHFSDNYSEVMTDGGNAYVWQYVDHILGVSLDSSRYNFAAEAVPFIGVVLHGSIRFAGEPLNMEGDLKYAMLKAIENGASPYFILSYQNTQVLKEDELLSKYYSIRYDIWNDDIINAYIQLNDILADVQDKYIVGHEFLSGATRVPDADEFMTDINGEYEAALDAHRNAAELLQKELEEAANIARENGRVAEAYAAEAVVKVLDLYASQMGFVDASAIYSTDYYARIKTAYAEYNKVSSFKNSKDPEEKARYERINDVYNIVLTFNVDYESTLARYDQMNLEYNKFILGESNKSFGDTVNSIYKDYAKNAFAYVQITSELAKEIANDEIENALKDFENKVISADEFVAIIDTYGAAYVDATALEDAIRDYLNGDLDHVTLYNAGAAWNKNKNKDSYKKAFEDALDAYLNRTLADSALDDAAAKWFDELESATVEELKTALSGFANKNVDKNSLKETIRAYASGKFNKDDVLAAIEEIKEANENFKVAEANYKLEPYANVDKDFKKDESDYNTALKSFDRKVNTFKSNLRTTNLRSALEDFEEAQSAYEQSLLRKTIDKEDAENRYKTAETAYNNAANSIADFIIKAMNEEQIRTEIAGFVLKADAYNEYLAAKAAKELAIDSGLTVSYDDCYKIYLNKYNNDKYSDFTSILEDGSYSEQDYALYKAYYDAEQAVEALEDVVDGIVIKTGAVDGYIEALAKYDYAVANRSEITDEEFTKLQNGLVQTRRQAKNSVIKVGYPKVDQIQEIYDTALGHVQLAIEAIDILALSEDYTLQYVEGEEESFLNIKITEDMPFVVKQAVERAQTAYYYIVEDRFVEIVEGFETDYTYNGHKLYRKVLPSNNTVYFYGTYETGYQYLTMNKDGSFSVYENNKSNAGGTVNGNIVYDNEKDFGKNVFYTIADGKMTYYTKVSEGVFMEKAPITYNGELFRTLDDGTEIYYDGSVYYSVNEDGTYTRYTYSQSINGCLEESITEKDRVFGIVKAIQDHKDASEATIYDEIIKSIEIKKLKDKEVEEEEVIVEEESKYTTENVVAVTYGESADKPCKTIILNYNNYAIRLEFDGFVYTIPAYGFVEIKLAEQK